MKVIHLISGGDSGGAKTHVHMLLQNLCRTPGVEITMVCFMEGPFSEEARALGIPVSVADAQEECTFFFPAVCLGDGLVAGVVSDGVGHRRTAEAAKAIRKTLEELA